MYLVRCAQCDRAFWLSGRDDPPPEHSGWERRASAHHDTGTRCAGSGRPGYWIGEGDERMLPQSTAPLDPARVTEPKGRNLNQSAASIHPDTPWQSTLHAVVDRIIPPDDFPGAWDAGAGDYILGQLGGQLREQTSTIESGLAALDAEARLASGRAFADLAPAEQDLLLAAIERNDVHTEWQTQPAAFFALLVELTAEGYYSDPGNGGNRNEIAWRMIGYQTRIPK
jgi:hypothetical protein